MNFCAVRWAREQTLHSSTKLILLILATYADDKYTCYPSQALLAKTTGHHRSSVARQLQQLEDDGLITRTRRSTTRGHRTSDLVTLKVPSAVDETTPAPVSDRRKRDQGPIPKVHRCDIGTEVVHRPMSHPRDIGPIPKSHPRDIGDEVVHRPMSHPCDIGEVSDESLCRTGATAYVAPVQQEVLNEVTTKGVTYVTTSPEPVDNSQTPQPTNPDPPDHPPMPTRPPSPPACQRHRHGNPTDEPCRRCRDVRLAHTALADQRARHTTDAALAARRSAAAAAAAATRACRHCDAAGYRHDRPRLVCDHTGRRRRTLADVQAAHAASAAHTSGVAA